MAIPKNIAREHVFQAMIKIIIEGENNRSAIRWVVSYEGQIFPCKLLISLANLYSNGVILNPNPNNFQTEMAKKYLKNLGFKIIEI